MYMAFSMLNSLVDTEVKIVKGRADVVVKTKSDIFVLELKVDDSVDNALAQIDSTGYAIPYESDGRKVTKCGVSISSEARNIVHWRSVDEEGNIIDEQKFLESSLAFPNIFHTFAPELQKHREKQ